MSIARDGQQKPTDRVLTELSAESGRHTRFPERFCLSQLSTPRRSQTVERALSAIAALEGPQSSWSLRSNFRELQEAFASLGDREHVVTSAFTDRALRLIYDNRIAEETRRGYLWGIVAAGKPDCVVSLFRVVSQVGKSPCAVVARDAALALSCHKDPLSHPLTLRAMRTLNSASISQEHREAVISGLASGVALRTALLIAATVSTGSTPHNDASPNGKFHHVALMREMIEKPSCVALRHRVLDEIGSMSHPFYLLNHPLMPPVLNSHTMLMMPLFLIDMVRSAVDLPDPIAQRKALQIVFPTYRDGSGREGDVIKDVLARRIGGHWARDEAEKFLEHFPSTHTREVRAEARRRKRGDAAPALSNPSTVS